MLVHAHGSCRKNAGFSPVGAVPVLDKLPYLRVKLPIPDYDTGKFPRLSSGFQFSGPSQGHQLLLTSQDRSQCFLQTGQVPCFLQPGCDFKQLTRLSMSVHCNLVCTVQAR